MTIKIENVKRFLGVYDCLMRATMPDGATVEMGLNPSCEWTTYTASRPLTAEEFPAIRRALRIHIAQTAPHLLTAREMERLAADALTAPEGERRMIEHAGRLAERHARFASA